MLERNGRAAEGLDLVQRLRSSRGEYSFGLFHGLLALEAGRLAERLGRREDALEAYQMVVDLWRHADPELQGFVTEARDGLARLTAEPRPRPR